MIDSGWAAEMPGFRSEGLGRGPWIDTSGAAPHGSAKMARRGCCCNECSAFRARMRAARMRAATAELRRLQAGGCEHRSEKPSR